MVSQTGNWWCIVVFFFFLTELQNNLVIGHGINNRTRSQSLTDHSSKFKMKNLTPRKVQYLPRNTELVNNNLKLKSQSLYSQHSLKSLYLDAFLRYYSSFSKQEPPRAFTPNTHFSLSNPFRASFAIYSKFLIVYALPCVPCRWCIETQVILSNISQAWWHGILPRAGLWLIP